MKRIAFLFVLPVALSLGHAQERPSSNSAPTASIETYRQRIEKGSTNYGDFLELGLLLKAQENYSGAIEILQKGIVRLESNRTPTNLIAQLHNNLGNVYRQKGDYATAIKCFETALQCDRAILGPNLNIGLCYDVGMKEPANAVPYYKEEIRRAPDDRWTYEAYLNLGILKQEEKIYGESIEFLKKAVQVNPSDFDRYKAIHALANSLYLTDRIKEAVENWRKVVELAPDTPSGRAARNNVDALK